MNILFLVSFIAATEVSIKELKVSDTKLYRIEVAPTMVSSIAERMRKGYSLGKLIDSSPAESANIPLARFHGHLANEMATLETQLKAVTEGLAQNARKIEAEKLRELTNEAVLALAKVEEGTLPSRGTLPQTWENFRLCVKEVERTVFEVEDRGPVTGCLQVLPDGVLPEKFEVFATANEADIILVYRDILQFTAEDLFWILPVIDRNFALDDRLLAKEIWTLIRYLRREGCARDEAFARIKNAVPSLMRKFEIPMRDPQLLLNGFCKTWREIYSDAADEIESLELCKQ